MTEQHQPQPVSQQSLLSAPTKAVKKRGRPRKVPEVVIDSTPIDIPLPDNIEQDPNQESGDSIDQLASLLLEEKLDKIRKEEESEINDQVQRVLSIVDKLDSIREQKMKRRLEKQKQKLDTMKAKKESKKEQLIATQAALKAATVSTPEPAKEPAKESAKESTKKSIRIVPKNKMLPVSISKQVHSALNQRILNF